jgi:cytochrome c peroxidase
MIRAYSLLFIYVLLLFVIGGCETSSVTETDDSESIARIFGNNINLNQLDNYSAQPIPSYITKDNAPSSPISNAKATLGRVLFYDKELSINRTVSCASCHQQSAAFSDLAKSSKGVSGTTARHSMRLVNVLFATEPRFFWDERAATLELQVTEPIKDHIEMGFSGQSVNSSFTDLVNRLSGIDYYRHLFSFAYGDNSINEQRIQESLAHFVRSIQSFDSKYDVGRAQVQGNMINFPNFTAQENMGKMLFTMAPTFNPVGNRVSGGLGCQRCHQAPEFDIDPGSRNNGVIQSISGQVDLTNTRAPSLRDLIGPNGNLNGPLMHNGAFASLESAILHYNDLTDNVNPQLDPRLRPAGNPQMLNMTQAEVEAVVAFLRTLTGTALYTDKKWSDPFTR